MTANLYDAVRLAREGADVERCHAHPHLMRYSVGHHSLSLVTLITLCWMHDHDGSLPSARLLTAAAFHDIPERVTGDVPQPVKVLLGGALEELDERVLRHLDVHVHLTVEEQAYLHHGDKLELWLWCWEEERRGNGQGFRSWIRDYDEFWSKSPPPLAYKLLVAEVKSEGGLERLDYYQIMEAMEP